MDEEKHIQTLPETMPVFPLSGAILLPGSNLPLTIFEPRYLQMVKDAKAGSGMIGMIQPTVSEHEDRTPPLYTTGGAGVLSSVQETKDGRLLINLKGISRFLIKQELDVTTPYRQVVADWAPFIGDQEETLELLSAGDKENLLNSLKAYLATQQLQADYTAITSAPDSVLVNTLAMTFPFSTAEKQGLLETETLNERCQLLRDILAMASAATNQGAPETRH